MSSLELHCGCEQLVALNVWFQPAFDSRRMPFSSGSFHSDVLQFDAKFLVSGVKVEKATHGVALLSNRSRHGHCLADEVGRLVDQHGSLGLRRARERAVLVGPTQGIPDEETAGYQRRKTDCQYHSHVYSFPALALSVASLALSKNGSNLLPKTNTAVQDKPEVVSFLLKSDYLLDGFLPFDKEVPVCREPACPNQPMAKVSCSATGSSGGVSMGLCSHLVNSRYVNRFSRSMDARLDKDQFAFER